MAYRLITELYSDRFYEPEKVLSEIRGFRYLSESFKNLEQGDELKFINTNSIEKKITNAIVTKIVSDDQIQVILTDSGEKRTIHKKWPQYIVLVRYKNDLRLQLEQLIGNQ